MPQPDFDPTEKYLIDYVKRSELERGSGNPYMWSYVILSAIIVGFAAWRQDIPMMLCGVAGVYGCRIYEDRYTKRYMPAWLSIIRKYEAAIARMEAE